MSMVLSHEQVSAHSTAFRTPRILVVEQNPRFEQMIQSMLHVLGVECICAHQPDEALMLFRQGFDLVLLDLQLSPIGSFELAHRMRSSESTDMRTPIIGHATVVFPEDAEPFCVEAGMDALSPKLTSLEDVFQLLRGWLRTAWVMPVYLSDVHLPEPIDY